MPGGPAVRHMELVQAVVARVETRCLSLKALAMAVEAIALGYVASHPSASFAAPLLAALALVALWTADARYLRLGRLYRCLYDALRQGEGIEPFSMDVTPFEVRVESVAEVFLGWSTCWFYVPLVGLLFVLNRLQLA